MLQFLHMLLGIVYLTLTKIKKNHMKSKLHKLKGANIKRRTKF